jgi:hypothetical protein
MFRKSTGCAAVAVLAITALPAFAHHPTGVSSTSGAGPIATISATTLDQGHSSVGVFFEMVKVDAFSDAQLTALAGQHVHAHSLDAILAPAFVFAYGLTSDLTVSARLPVIIRQDIREGEHTHGGGGAVNSVVERGDSSGIGDLTLLGQYRFFNNRATRTEAALLFGVKAPTGETGVIDNTGERFEAEFQPGSGSWDALVGLAFTKRLSAWSFDANVLYQQINKGTQDTDLGDRFLYNAAVSYRVLGDAAASTGRMNLGAMPDPMYHGGPKQRGAQHTHAEPPPSPPGPALDLVLELNGEWHARQEIASVKNENSGGNVVYLSPGVRLSFDKWSGFASVGIPVINRTNGIQAEPDWRLLTGIAVNF